MATTPTLSLLLSTTGLCVLSVMKSRKKMSTANIQADADNERLIALKHASKAQSRAWLRCLSKDGQEYSTFSIPVPLTEGAGSALKRHCLRESRGFYISRFCACARAEDLVPNL
ncbi:hypothetical protein IWZ00DRAFT_499692 [Phyllosticta capitalensis]